MIVNRSHFPARAGFSAVSKMNAQLQQLQVKLATGQKYSTLAEMGGTRSSSLSLNARLDRVSAYQSNIDTVSTRLSFLDNAMTRLDKIQSTARTSVAVGGYGTNNINLQTAPTFAFAQLDEVLTLLNTEADGRYVMGGDVTDRPPVQTISAILDGANGRDGFRTIVAERKAADLGTTLQGRLTTAVATDTVTLSEDGAHPFGFKLSTISTDSSSITTTNPTGAPQSLTVQFTALPQPGQRVTLGMTMPDGTNESIVMTAVSGPTTKPGEFQIGADPAATAANFEAGLKTTLQFEGQSRLAAASTFAAADNFFNSAGQPVQRVVGPPGAATALTPATATDTVAWYTGDPSTTPARQSVAAKIDDSTTVNYGVRANEPGLVGLVRSLASMAVETYPPSASVTDASRGKFDAMAQRQNSRLSESNNVNAGSIKVITVELGVAKATLGNVDDRHTTYSSQLQTMLADLEQAPMEEIAMQLLTLKTRLEATYNTTATISQLSLVNYLK